MERTGEYELNEERPGKEVAEDETEVLELGEPASQPVVCHLGIGQW
jgi:hypothetical protein